MGYEKVSKWLRKGGKQDEGAEKPEPGSERLCLMPLSGQPGKLAAVRGEAPQPRVRCRLSPPRARTPKTLPTCSTSLFFRKKLTKTSTNTFFSFYFPHTLKVALITNQFTDEDTEGQRGEVTCPRPHSYLVAREGLESA